MVSKPGGCHCGAVRFEVDFDADCEVFDCNCSICGMTGFLHLIVPQSQFHLIKGREQLGIYRFNTGTAEHLFCTVCGIKSFYVPRSHPNGISVNYRCLDGADMETVRIVPFDGRNWEQSACGLAPPRD